MTCGSVSCNSHWHHLCCFQVLFQQFHLLMQQHMACKYFELTSLLNWNRIIHASLVWDLSFHLEHNDVFIECWHFLQLWQPLTLLTPHEWPRQNFSLQYHYNIKQKSNENKEKYKLREYKMIQYQILQTNIIRTVWQMLGELLTWSWELEG